MTTTSQDVTRRDPIRQDIARRIGRVCAHLTEEEFRRLTEEMADRQLRSERRANQNYRRDLDPRTECPAPFEFEENRRIEQTLSARTLSDHPAEPISHSMEQDDPTETEVVDRLKSDIRRRLSDVCSELSEADKGVIVDRLARSQGPYPEAEDPRVT